MKKIFGILLAVVLGFTAVSCSSGPDNSKAEAVVQKIDNGDELTQADYTVMLQYTIDYLDYSTNLLKKITGSIDNENPTPAQVEKLSADLKKAEEETEAKFPYAEQITKKVFTIPDDKYEGSNQELCKKYHEKMEEFLKTLNE